MKAALRAAGLSLIGLVLLGALLFWPAGTFHYWQAWVFLAVFAVSTGIPGIYLLFANPAALERRMRAGPAAETRTLQKVVIGVSFLSAAALLVLSGFDHRFGWSTVPAAASLVGDVLVVIGLGIAVLAVIQNSYAAGNIRVEAEQRLVCTGLYGLVRHPMYVGNLVMIVGIPLALGSYWGLVFVIASVIVLAVRIVDEEKALAHELAGYTEYMQRVRYRLVPYVW
jgi:protein-S-isoprenylcysteine O-methyltransferase Ste14